MGKFWVVGDDRWNSAHQIRVSRRFRYHVKTKYNPKGRIRRERCSWCLTKELKRSRYPQAHHVDYDFPFLVVWCCEPHHRMIERGEIKIRKRDLWDYSSLVRAQPQLWVGQDGERIVPF